MQRDFNVARPTRGQHIDGSGIGRGLRWRAGTAWGASTAEDSLSGLDLELVVEGHSLGKDGELGVFGISVGSPSD